MPVTRHPEAVVGPDGLRRTVYGAVAGLAHCNLDELVTGWHGFLKNVRKVAFVPEAKQGEPHASLGRLYVPGSFDKRPCPTMIQARRFAMPLLGMALLAVMLAACDSTGPNDTTEHPEDEDPPKVIPPGAFALDVDLFSDSNPDTENTRKAYTGEYAHFTNAAVRVWPVSSAIKASLIIPATVTQAATQANPVVDAGTWIWETAVDTTDRAMMLRLTGTPDDASVSWSMTVTNPEAAQGPPLDNFELYTAETALDGSSGAYALYLPFESTRRHVLDANFTAGADSTTEVTFRVPEAAGQYAGHSVRYAVNGSERSFEWTQVHPSGNKATLVTWNADTKEGSIVAPSYNDGEQACWNANLKNVACAE